MRPIICVMPECQTTAGCLCRLSGIVTDAAYIPPFIPSPADNYYASLIAQKDAEIERLRRELAEARAEEGGFGDTVGSQAVAHLRSMYRPAYETLGSSGRVSLRNFTNARVEAALAEARAAAFIEAAEIAYAICSRDKTAVRLQLLIVDVLRAKAGEGR